MKVTNDYWRCVQSRSLWWVTVGSRKMMCIYVYTWLRMAEGRVVDGALIDNVLLPRRMLGILLDMKVYRGEEGGGCLPIFWWKLG